MFIFGGFPTATTDRVRAAEALGPRSGEGAELREQLWYLPTPDAATVSHASLYRPGGDGPFPLAIIAHGSVQSPIRRAQMSLPRYVSLAEALVMHGYAVVVPQRPGHGETGGPYLEDQGECASADYERAARATADSIRSAITFMRDQPFISRAPVLVVGHSAGGLGALALAREDRKAIARIVVFAAGRGGRAGDHAGDVCSLDRLIATTSALGRGAQVPVTWFVAANDSFFPPELSRRLAIAFGSGGDRVDFRVLPRFGSDGHGLALGGDARMLAALLRQ